MVKDYNIYIRNNCLGCQNIVAYFKNNNIQVSFINLDVVSNDSTFKIQIVPALVLNNRLLAYGSDIIQYFEK